jgi:hypothetical protein
VRLGHWAVPFFPDLFQIVNEIEILPNFS